MTAPAAGTRAGRTPAGTEGADMKVRSSLRALKRKAGSIVVRRRGKLFVLNKADRRQKARQG
ncbi:50S ribosomal protein L36 [Micromonospora provocatoris]|nr:50S ribosomal protein L36 [Micromonospora provocatoris]